MRQWRVKGFPIVYVTLAFCTLAVCGCGAGRQVATEEPVPELIVAHVDGQPITATQVQQELRRQQVSATSALEDEYHKQRALDTLITNTAVRNEAQQIDFSQDFSVRTALRQNLMQRSLNIYVQEVIAPRLAVTENDVNTYWQEHPEQFTVQQLMVYPQHIMIHEDLKDRGGKKPPPEYDGWTAEAMINDLYLRLQQGEDLDYLAQVYSNDVGSRVQGGNLGWRIYDEQHNSLWQDSLFAFPTGRTMPPFYEDGSLYIVRINGRRLPGEVVEPDEKMKAEVGAYIGKKRMNEWMPQFKDSLLTAAELEIIDSTLEIPIDELPDGLPMAISSGVDTTFGREFRTQSLFFKTQDGSQVLKLVDKKNLLHSLHEHRTLLKAMRDLGYLDRPEIQQTKQEYLIETGELRVRAAAVDRKYSPSEEDISSYYKEHLVDYLPERPVHVQHIVLDNPDTAWAVKRRLADGAAFVDLAREYYQGDPEMAEVTYDLGFIAVDDLPLQFFEAAVALEEGGISAPVQTEWGYHIIRVVKIKDATPMKKARPEIRSRLLQRHKAEVYKIWLDELLARHVIEIDSAALAAVPIPQSDTTDSSAPGDVAHPPGP